MTAVHWFRKGLRLHDNPALWAALNKEMDGTHLEVRPVFVLDPWFVQNARVGPNRWRFLLQSLADLDSSLRKLGSRLFVLRGKPEEVFPEIINSWKVKLLTYEMDTEPYAVQRDAQIDKLMQEHKVEVVKMVSHTLYESAKIVAANGGSPPLTYQKFLTIVNKLGAPESPLDAPVEVPKDCKTKELNQKYDVPTLEELKVDTKSLGPNLYPGGETEALKRLEIYMAKKEWVCKFSKPDTAPNSLQPSTTVLSPYLKFGCLSPRLFYSRLQEVIRGKKHTDPPVSLQGQLLWREFFYTVGAVTPNFEKMEGNAISKQIPWDDKPELLQAWREAKTGYPFIDAIMTQLRTEGWVHHLARHAVACFLTRGDYWISWVEGAKVFEEWLLDADWFLNAGNWMWLSASAFFHQYYRVYSPVAFGKKTDKDGAYIKKYLPQLKKIPAEYIYEPWKAPLSVQKAANCIIGQDYPKPLLKHEDVQKRNLERMNLAYSKGKAATSAAKRKADTSPKKPASKITAYLKK